MEMAVVLVVLVGLAGLVVPYMTNASSRAACTATETSMVAIRNAIVGSFENPGYREDMNRLPTILDELFQQGGQASFNPITKRGWRGPYLISAQTEDAYLTGNQLIIQEPTNDADGDDCSDLGFSDPSQCARLISFGPDGTLDTLAADTDGSTRGDDRILYLFIQDPNAGLSIDCSDI